VIDVADDATAPTVSPRTLLANLRLDVSCPMSIPDHRSQE
jgi:hypothetical protein